MLLQFTVPATALLFETDREKDQKVYVGCECNNGQGYQGMLSNIPPLAAQLLVEQGSNLVRFKQKQNEQA
ncbi:MAG: hypothetical protein EOO14_11915 [Chitinophagaceae bacterium]|nr:MAG: hypothetical protein EOO14_11915 [Chitinophagaceae bacterium]